MRVRGLFVVAAAGLAFVASSANAAILCTVGIREAGTGNTVINCNTPGATLNLEIYAAIHQTDGNKFNDGFKGTMFSIVSGANGSQPRLLGNVLGDPNGGPYASTDWTGDWNNYSGGARNGVMVDLDADGDLDVGYLGSNAPSSGANAWARPWSGSPVEGTITTGDYTDLVQVLGGTKFVVSSNPAANSSTIVKLIERISTSTISALMVDGSTIMLTGGDTRLVMDSAGLTINYLPEPATMALLAVGSVMTLIRRRRN